MNPRITAREDRASRKADTARALRRALADHDVSILSLAVLLGVSPSRVHRWTDPESGESIPLSDLIALPPVVRRSLLEWAAEPLGLVVIEPPLDGEHEHDAVRDLLVELVGESADASRALADAQRDGAIDALEGARLEREAREAESAARRVREIGRRAIDERVVMLRGKRREGER
jgi:AraC-like DNA-binding protein